MKPQLKVVIVVQLMLVTIHSVTGSCKFTDFQNYTNSIKDCDAAKNIKFNVSSWPAQEVPFDFINQTKSIESVDVTNQSLHDISNKGFCGWNLISLNAGMNKIELLPANLLARCSSLKYLLLSDNNITTISENAFQNLTLSLLDLSYNKIENFNANVWQPLTSLNELRLNNNNLKTITADMFKYISKLTILDVSNNFIANIEGGSFSEMKSLTTLNISFNPALNFIHLIEMPQLQVLNIEGAQLTQLIVTQNLVKIVANFNKISLIFIEQPKCMLKEMYLSDNLLRDVKWLKSPSIENLNILDVANNKISDLFSWFLINMKVQQFNISGNPIYSNVEDIQVQLKNQSEQVINLSKNVFEKNLNLTKEINDLSNQRSDFSEELEKIKTNLHFAEKINNLSKNVSKYSELLKQLKTNQNLDNISEKVSIFILQLSGFSEQVSKFKDQVSNYHVLTYCTIIAFLLCIIFQICIFIYQNRMRWNVPFPNMFASTRNGRPTYRSGQYEDHFPNLLNEL